MKEVPVIRLIWPHQTDDDNIIDDYNVPLLDVQPHVEPTYSVVELPKPSQDPNQPEPEEAIIRSVAGHPVVNASEVQHQDA